MLALLSDRVRLSEREEAVAVTALFILSRLWEEIKRLKELRIEGMTKSPRKRSNSTHQNRHMCQ